MVRQRMSGEAKNLETDPILGTEIRSSATRTLKAILRTHPGKLAFAFFLIILENALLVFYPLFAGFAIDAILRGDIGQAVWYAAIVLAFWLVGAARRAVDTRIFTRIYAALAVDVVVSQRLQEQTPSVAAARVVLAREFVDFFEKHIPTIATAVISLIGAAVMLAIVEPIVGFACFCALLFCAVWVPAYARRNEQLYGRLHNRLEREISLITKTKAQTLLRHYTVLSRLRIWLSDREAGTFLMVGVIAAALFALAIAHMASMPGVQAGHIYAVMTYLWNFVTGLDEAPAIIDQIARLRDIGKRVEPQHTHHSDAHR